MVGNLGGSVGWVVSTVAWVVSVSGPAAVSLWAVSGTVVSYSETMGVT